MHVFDERYYRSISHLHHCVAQSLRCLQTRNELESSMCRGTTSKKRRVVEIRSFRTNRSFFDFCVQNWLRTSYRLQNRDSRRSTLPLGLSKFLTAKVNFCGQQQRILTTVLGINFRTVFTEHKTMHHTSSFTFWLVSTTVALPLIMKKAWFDIYTACVEPSVTHITRDHAT